jgi:hypothetical protein
LYAWRLGQRTATPQNAAGLSLDNLNKWLPLCLNYPGRGTACTVVFSFPFRSGERGEQYAILGFTKNWATLTTPVERFTITSWLVDEHPFVETLSTHGDGATLSRRGTAKLILQMLTGSRLQVRFVESGTNRKIDESFPLDGFPAAYSRYQQMRKNPAIAYSW